VLTLFSRNARDGRRRGIGVCLIAHRIAGINKDVLLCEWMILHRPQATDLKRYMELVPTVPKERFQRLRQGQAVVVSPSGIRDILFHKARSHDNGATPGLAQLRLHEEQRTLASIGADQRASCSTHEPAR
jgi:DNA helicase HerA-like ATPase